MALPLRLLLSTVLATSAILMPTGTASAADTETPVLSSFSVSETQVIPGQQVTFSYAATEGSGSLSRLRLQYIDNSGRAHAFTFDGPLPVAGSVTITVPDTWRNGPAALDSIVLADPSGNGIIYYVNGSAYVIPTGASGPTSHTLPFTSGNLTVSGSTADSTVPTLTAVSASGSPAQPGETISVHYGATDTSGTLKSVALTFVDTRHQIGRKLTVPGTGPVPLNGVVEQVIPATWPNGTYLLTQVTLTDPHDNVGRYNVNGSVSATPSTAQSPSSNTVDFGPATFTVSGSTADFTPPTLTSVTRTGSPMLRDGTATLSYAAESQDPLSAISFRYASPNGRSVTFALRTPQLSGTFPATIPADKYPNMYGLGQYTLQEISLSDSAGNNLRYFRNGTTSQNPGRIAGTHTIALSTMDLNVGELPRAPYVDGVRVGSGSTIVFFGPWIELAIPMTRYTVTAQPGGRTVTTSGSADEADVTGLTNGTTYRFTVKATNMFGTSAASAPSAAVTPMMSTNIVGTGDFNGDGRNDLIGVKFTAERMATYRSTYLYRGNGRGGFTGTTALKHPYTEEDRIVFSPGDFDGNGASDVMIIGDNGWLRIEPGNGRGGFAPQPGRKYISPGWGVMRTVFGPGDFSGDRKNDVLAVRKDGGLYLYRGNGRGGFAGAGQKIGHDWSKFLTVFSPGDFNGDGKNDVMAVSKSGGLYLYRGNGRGGFAATGQKIGTGWGGFLSVFSPGDFTGDHRADVMAVTSTGDLRLYRGNGRGGWAGGAQKIGSGWNIFR
jgi:hypothetical protein